MSARDGAYGGSPVNDEQASSFGGTTYRPSSPSQATDRYSSAPEVVPSTLPEYLPSPDHDGQKMTVPQPFDPHSLPVPASTVVNEDPRSGLQVVGSENKEFSPTVGTGYVPYTKEGDGSPAAMGAAGDGDGTRADAGESGPGAATALPPKPWYKRKKYVGIAAVILLAVIALAVGLGVGLSQGGGDGSDNGKGNGNDGGAENGAGGRQGGPQTGSGGDDVFCDGGACPPILSAPAMDSTLHLLARSQNSSLALRTRGGENEGFDSWTDLGQIPVGNIVAQPAAISWKPNGDSRLDVFSLSSDKGTVYTRHRNDGNGQWSDWAGIGDHIGSRIVTCRPRDERIDLFALDADSGDIVHNYFIGGNTAARRRRQLDEDELDEDEPDEDEPDEDGTPNPPAQPTNPPNNGGGGENNGDNGNNSNEPSWSTTSGAWPAIEPRRSSRSLPAVCCRDSSTLHDVVYYNATHALHTSYSPSTNWTIPHAIAGEFMGDPVVFAPEDDAEMFMFFGIKDDNALYTFTWRSRNGGEYTDLVSIGDNVASMPSVVSVQSDIVDVVVLGTDGTLKHQHYNGRSWRSDWENLNITAMSAPTTVEFDKETWIFSVDVEGRLQAASLEADEDTPEWRDRLQEENLGGDLELRYYYNS